ncbi:MAG: hypothetical protein U5N53_24270 [Mycobacterium sp.]|nr:hypothetical protein [Mycobacterium sp.]
MLSTISAFLDEGFRQLTRDDIASRLRCSKSTLNAFAPARDRSDLLECGFATRGQAALFDERLAFGRHVNACQNLSVIEYMFEL